MKFETEPFSDREIVKAEGLLARIVPKAGDILRKYYQERNYSTKQKEGVDFTTQADIETDEYLRNEIAKIFPSHKFLTEETAPSDWSSLEGEGFLWVIDPLDGTINFSRGEPNFAISVALVSHGKTLLGVAYNPITDDYYTASEAREGVFKNGERVKVSEVSELREVTLACDWAWGLEKRLNVVEWLGKVSTHIRQVKSMGSAVADLARVAEGKVDVYLHSGLKPWDIAASAYFVQKAGGKVTLPDGRPWNVFEQDIFASNGILHQKIGDLIKS